MTFSWVTKGSSVSSICPLGKRDALQSTVYQNTKEWGDFLTFRWHSTLARLSQILLASWQWTVPRGYFASLRGFIRLWGWSVVLKETMLYTCPREKNFPRIITMNHAHLELEMCKIQEIRMSRERAGNQRLDQSSLLMGWIQAFKTERDPGSLKEPQPEQEDEWDWFRADSEKDVGTARWWSGQVRSSLFDDPIYYW